jgi:hypothetical protein
MVIKDASFAEDAWTLANVFRAQIGFDGIRVRIHLNCQTSTMMFMDYYHAVICYHDQHNPDHALTTSRAPLVFACISLDHAWICMMPKDDAKSDETIPTHYNMIEAKSSSIVIDWKDPTLFLPLLTRARSDKDGGLRVMTAVSGDRPSVTLARAITVTNLQFAGVMCETFIRECIDHLMYHSTSPAELHKLIGCVVSIINNDSRLQFLDRSSNIWYMIADLFVLPSIRLARSSQLRAAYNVALQPLLHVLAPITLPSSTLLSSEARNMATSIVPDHNNSAPEWSMALLCYCQSIVMSTVHYNYRPRVRLQKFLTRYNLATIDVPARGATDRDTLIARLKKVDTQCEQLLSLCHQLEGKTTTSSSTTNDSIDDAILVIARDKFLSNLWQYAVFPQTSAKAPKKPATVKRASSNVKSSDEAVSTSAPQEGTTDEAKTQSTTSTTTTIEVKDNASTSSSINNGGREMDDALLELDRCRVLLGAASVVLRTQLATPTSSVASSSTSSNGAGNGDKKDDDGKTDSVVNETTKSDKNNKRKLVNGESNSDSKSNGTKKARVNKKKALELFSVDQVEAERQKGLTLSHFALLN